MYVCMYFIPSSESGYCKRDVVKHAEMIVLYSLRIYCYKNEKSRYWCFAFASLNLKNGKKVNKNTTNKHYKHKCKQNYIYRDFVKAKP